VLVSSLVILFVVMCGSDAVSVCRKLVKFRSSPV
jgi:hypothetical protein